LWVHLFTLHSHPNAGAVERQSAIDPKLDQRITAAGLKHVQESTATEKLQKKIDQAGSDQN
jgi:hypothetical protein